VRPPRPSRWTAASMTRPTSTASSNVTWERHPADARQREQPRVSGKAGLVRARTTRLSPKKRAASSGCSEPPGIEPRTPSLRMAHLQDNCAGKRLRDRGQVREQQRDPPLRPRRRTSSVRHVPRAGVTTPTRRQSDTRETRPACALDGTLQSLGILARGVNRGENRRATGAGGSK